MRRAAVGAAGIISLVVLAACDTGTTAGHNWVITPDIALHRQTGKPLIRATGQCSDGSRTWIAKSGEYNVWSMTQGQTLIVTCFPGYPVGTWGLEERAS
jgi:hypothetical protein